MTISQTEVEIATFTQREQARSIIRPLRKQLDKAYGVDADAYRIRVTDNVGLLKGYRLMVAHPELDAVELQSRLLAVFSQILVFQWAPYH